MTLIALLLSLAFPAQTSGAAVFAAAPAGPPARAVPEPAGPSAKEAPAAEEPGEGMQILHCEAAPGVAFCRKLDRIESLMKMGCTGEACMPLFARMRSTLEDFTNRYTDEAPAKYNASEEFGKKARAAAKAICATEITGTPSVVTTLALAMNEALPLIKEIQVRSGAKDPYSCTISVN